MPTKVKICLALMNRALIEPLGARFLAIKPGCLETVQNMRSTCYHLRSAAQALGEHKYDRLKFSIRSEDGGVSLNVTNSLPEDGQVESIGEARCHPS